MQFLKAGHSLVFKLGRCDRVARAYHDQTPPAHKLVLSDVKSISLRLWKMRSLGKSQRKCVSTSVIAMCVADRALSAQQDALAGGPER